MKTRSLLAIRHVDFEDLGAFASPIRDAGFSIHYWDIAGQAPPVPEPDDADLLMVLGGPIGAYEDDTYPFLRDEIEILERRLEAGRPIMGVCLGAQLLARAAGARVRPGGVKEIGFLPISLTDGGLASCLAPFADEPMALHWHGDTFDLPDDAVLLASTEACENQAFSMGRNVIGFQFHPEASAKGFGKWLVGHAVELATAGTDVPRLRAAAERYGPELERKAHLVATRWLAGLEDDGRHTTLPRSRS